MLIKKFHLHLQKLGCVEYSQTVSVHIKPSDEIRKGVLGWQVVGTLEGNSWQTRAS